MNEKTFLKELNREKSEEKKSTRDVLLEFLNSENQSIGFLSKFRILKKLFSKKERAKQEVIKDNLDIILRNAGSDELLSIIDVLAKNNETRDFVKDNIQQILKHVLDINSHYIFSRENDLCKNLEQIYGQEFANESKKVFIENNIDIILSKINKSYLLESTQNLIGISNKIDTKINKTIELNKKNVIGHIIRSMKQEHTDAKEIEHVVNQYTDDVLQIIEDCMKSEHIRWIDIEKVTKEARHKDIYRIGSKVLRIGGIWNKKELPVTTRILQPIESHELLNRGIPYATIEITDTADRLDKSEFEGKGIYDGYGEDMYQLYKELRNSNIIWIDAPHSLGFKKGAEKTLQNMMILDSDSLYNSEDTENLKRRQLSNHSKIFEDRWKREREEKLAKLNPQHIQIEPLK